MARKHQIHQKVFWTLFFSSHTLGVSSNSTWHVPWNRNKQRELEPCRSLGEVRQSREAGSPEQPQREVQRPLAQSRPPAAPKNKQGRCKPDFSSLVASQSTRAPTRSRIRSNLRSLYLCRCCPREALGLRQAPKTSHER